MFGRRNIASAVLVCGVVIVHGLPADAVAADMPVKAIRKAPPPVYVHNWSGCYAGGNAGWIRGADRLTNYPGASVVAAVGLTPAETAEATNIYTPGGSGFTGGVQVGCNWQGAGSPFVLGIESDFNWSGLKESETRAIPLLPLSGFQPHSETVTKQVDRFATVRGRLGFAVDRWLAFVTGGLAVARIESSQHFVFNVAQTFYTGSTALTRVGWTIGGGGEFAFTNNLSAKLEYLYLDFGTFTFDSPFSIVNPPVAWATDVRAREHIVRVGLNYHFGAPVVAKY